MTRKMRKKKWILVPAFLLSMGLLPLEGGSSPTLSDVKHSNPSVSAICGRDELYSRGGCDAGSGCCGGFPEAQCGSGGGFPVY
jgi:hypothetical protein